MSFDKIELFSIKNNAISVVSPPQWPLTLNSYSIDKSDDEYKSGAKLSFAYGQLGSIFKSFLSNYLAYNSQLFSYNSSRDQQSEQGSAFQAINSYRVLIVNKHKYSTMQLLKATMTLNVLLSLINQTFTKNKVISEVAISNSA